MEGHHMFSNRRQPRSAPPAEVVSEGHTMDAQRGGETRRKDGGHHQRDCFALASGHKAKVGLGQHALTWYCSA